MTFQEILEGITKHRANPVTVDNDRPPEVDIKRKLDEVEWALQALAETLRDREAEWNQSISASAHIPEEKMYSEPVRKKKHK